jgi:hypothetical protein
MLRQIDEQQFQSIAEKRGHPEIAFNQVASIRRVRRFRIAETAEIEPWSPSEAISFTTASPGAPALAASHPGFSPG